MIPSELGTFFISEVLLLFRLESFPYPFMCLSGNFSRLLIAQDLGKLESNCFHFRLTSTRRGCVRWSLDFLRKFLPLTGNISLCQKILSCPVTIIYFCSRKLLEKDYSMKNVYSLREAFQTKKRGNLGTGQKWR